MKTCTKCLRSLPKNSFNKSTRNKSGLRAECRECQSEASKGYPGPAKPKSQLKTRYLKKRVNGVNVPIHRHVMELKLGRKLLANEVVHHINGNKHDNRPENLEVMDAGFHSRIENLGRILSEEHRAKLSKSGKGKPHKQFLRTPEHKARISLSVKIARAMKFWSTKKK